uniref:Uncharacterized protein n=1 Tax=Mus musculus TaxID=10090 RepID=Q8C258_MOUSE|nr:unnamed protein product [Mus musculus]
MFLAKPEPKLEDSWQGAQKPAHFLGFGFSGLSLVRSFLPCNYTDTLLESHSFFIGYLHFKCCSPSQFSLHNPPPASMRVLPHPIPPSLYEGTPPSTHSFKQYLSYNFFFSTEKYQLSISNICEIK